MFRSPVDSDPHINHIWTEDTRTECGITGERLPGYGTWLCVTCVKRYGTELAAAFSHLPWRAGKGTTQHAFEPADLAQHPRLITPVCRLWAMHFDDLKPDPLRMRCPHCLAELRFRRRRDA
jgi:hypothetical protein